MSPSELASVQTPLPRCARAPAPPGDELARALAETAPVLLWAADPAGRIEYLAPTWDAYTGLAATALRTGGWDVGVHPDDRAGVERQWAEAVRDGGRFEAEFRLRRHDGEYEWHLARATAVRDDGRVVRWAGAVTNVDAVRREAAGFDLLKAVSEGTPDVVFVKDRAGRYLMINPAGARNVARPVEDVLGRDDTELFPPDTAARVTANDCRVMATGRAETCEVEAVVAGVPRVFQATKGPYRDRDGSVAGVIGISRDVTDQVRAVADLRRSESLLRLVWEGAADGMRLTDRDGVVRMANPAYCRMVGRPPEEVVGRPFNEAYAPARAADILRRHHEQFAARTARPHFTAEVELWDGRRRWFEVGAAFLDNPGDAPLLLGIVRDVTRRMWAEKHLRESEQRYRELFAVNPHPMWVYDTETLHFLAVNDAAVTRYGYSREEFLGMRLTDVRPAEEVPAFLENARQPTVGLQARGVWRHRWKDGTLRSVEVASHDIRYADRPARLVLALDVTDRLRAEDALRASEARFRAVVEKSYDAVSLTAADGTVLYVSPSSLAISGFTPEEVAGRSVLGEMVHPDDRPAVWAQFRDQLAKPGSTVSVTYRLWHKDGSWRWVEVRRTNLLADPAVGAFVANLRDVTDRRAAEAALREREELLRTILAHIPAGVFWKDSASVYRGCNDRFARDHGFCGPDAVIGTTDRDLTPDPAEAAAFVAWDRRVLDTGQPVLDVEEQQTWIGGRAAVLLTSKVPLRDAAGAVVGVLGVYQDVTDRRRLEEQYRQAQKMEAVGRLAAGVAHDFNNLLTVINGYADILLATVPEADPAHPLVDEVRKAGDRAAGLTRQLLAFGRKQLFQQRILDLGSLVAGLAGMLRRVIGEDVTLTVRSDPDLLPVTADPGQIEQVLMNLAVNARDAMPAGGTLTIETRNVFTPADGAGGPGTARGGPAVLLAVSDTGTGMTDEVKARAFEPFFTTKEKGKGTGLGLATVYGIVRQSGGSVEFDSRIGAGTTFRVYLPAAAGQAPSADRPLPEAAVPRGTETLLLVEDDDEVRRLALRVLRAGGYAVLDAAGGHDALRAAGACGAPIDLLVTDVVMPGMGGRELAERLRAGRPGLPVLYLSGYTDDAVVRDRVERAEMDFLPKPYSPTALARKVREILDRKR